MAFHRKKAFAALLIWFLPVMGMSAEAVSLKPEVKQRLELLKAGFDSFVLKTVTIPFEEGLAKLGDKVVPALKRESSAAAERKDLDAMVRIKSDLERLSKGQVLTAADVPAPPAALAVVYATYKVEYLKLQTARETGFADARQRYDRGLATMQDELTAQENIDGAVYVKQLRADLAAAVAGTEGARPGQPRLRAWLRLRPQQEVARHRCPGSGRTTDRRLSAVSRPWHLNPTALS
ncbi:MAG: hypothetical protein JWR15_2847 [Prosthecobacter sp.]|nr:hypothetical protein [Prosthecobacter sp.]